MIAKSDPTGIARYLPIAGWLAGYRPVWLRADMLAGLTAAAVVIPEAMAHATIAGLPVQIGLYTALTPLLIYAALGTSRPLSVSTTSTISMLTAAVLAGKALSGGSAELFTVAVTLAALVGGLLVMAGLLRLGVIANFISAPVLTGFKAGIGVVIIVGQLGKVMGIPADHGPFFNKLLSIISGLGGTHPTTFILAMVSIIMLLFLPRLISRLPAPLVVVTVGIIASAFLDLKTIGVKLVGEVTPGLPSFSLPDLALLSDLLPAALGIALIAFIESTAAARSFQRQDEPTPNPDQELIALGMANIGGSLFHAMPSGGGTSQTAVNDRTGVKTQLASIITALLVAVTLLFLAPVISLMPEATLGALVLVAATGLIKVGDFNEIRRISMREWVWAIVAFVGVITLGTLEGILIAVAVSLLNLMIQSNHPPVYEMGRKKGTDIFRPMVDHPNDETIPGLLILRTEGRLHFASSPRAVEQMRNIIRERQPQVVILECSSIPDIEYTALKQLTEGEQKLAESGVELWLAALNPIPLGTIRRSPLGATLGNKRMFRNTRLAVEAFRQFTNLEPDDQESANERK